MSAKEAKARLKINKLLEDAGWRFFDDKNGTANIQVEPNVKITKKQIDSFGNDFDTIKNGFIDFLLLDDNGTPPLLYLRQSGTKPVLSTFICCYELLCKTH